jgi:Protein of unknown function (DUF3039)
MGFIDANSDTIVEDQVELDNSNGDHDRFAHYVNKSDMMEAYVEGKPVVALCGKVWVPDRDPTKFKLCPTCKQLYEMMFSAKN